MRDVCNVPACHFLISFARPCSSTIRTAHGHDFRDAELVASAFAEDGVLRVSPTRATGWVGRRSSSPSLEVLQDVYVKTAEGWRFESRTLNCAGAR